MRTRHTLHTLPTFPVWSAGFISDTRLVLGGGGGTGRTGVKNKLRLYDVQDGGEKIELLNESLMEKDEDAPMTLAVNPQDGSLVCGVNASSESIEKGVNEHCRLYRMKGNELSLENQKQFVSTNDVEVYQTATAFSPDRSLVAVGTTDNVVSIASYPSLAAIAAPFQIPEGKLYTLDFSDDTLLITTDTALYLVPLPLANGKEKAEDTDEEGTLPELEASQTMPVPTSDLREKSPYDKVAWTFRSAKFNPKNPRVLLAVVNSAPYRKGKMKLDRRSYLIRWELPGATVKGAAPTAVGDAAPTISRKIDEKWTIRKVRKIGNRAITVFEISEGGNLAAYGASDSSVGIVDAHVLSPIVTILKAHDFPPTTLQFNPSSTLLVSGSADASIRAIVVPPSFTSSSTLQICLLLIALFILVAAILIQR